MKSLIFWVFLSSATLGCEQIPATNVGGCLTLLWACNGAIVPPVSRAYCDATHMPGDEPYVDYWGDCQAFRRGQVCQCVTPACIDLLIESLERDATTVEDIELLSDVQDFGCPRSYEYHTN